MVTTHFFSYPEVARGGSIVDVKLPKIRAPLKVLVGTSAPKRRYSLLRPGGSGVKHPKGNYVTRHSPAREAVRQVTILGFHDHFCPRRFCCLVSQTISSKHHHHLPYDSVLPSSHHGSGYRMQTVTPPRVSWSHFSPCSINTLEATLYP
ncbi:hypothetical protein BO85DRAFT_14067 [Aspergillus piperis CBS 112811]|uniref:Uncharacterized protein n=1 Tax=Aspergillus piperis CBS 112811 TaxID=1448313 RepID=A0A8G1RE22_9EURO|nr:hypothetical protein BO85DRAFT_14067 [Aspergillus piperis CBS 112811]RAH62969.1 hypothetical protein BO85DRAFT_14067 [Aspergillus piperis CBS 112811]